MKIDNDVIEQVARQLYEDGRKRVSGRPAWENLDPRCPYDMGMRSVAIERATRELASE
ncbi:hypothetical protein [Pseudohoeflea suaedae]|uniref:hypothetical protein n=1 Tax=Pseudohoeflea suaedae TaxID=877384 RepID=UPI001304D84D|nr:hypothetical protein [Pseudohoeflea suaedae]